MDGQEQVLVGRGADHVGDGPEAQRKEGRIAEEVRRGELQEHDARDGVLCQGLRAAEFEDLSGNVSVSQLLMGAGQRRLGGEDA